MAEKLVACNFPLATTALVLLLQSNPYNGFKSLLFFSSFVMYSLVFICIEPPKHDFWAVLYCCTVAVVKPEEIKLCFLVGFFISYLLIVMRIRITLRENALKIKGEHP